MTSQLDSNIGQSISIKYHIIQIVYTYRCLCLCLTINFVSRIDCPDGKLTADSFRKIYRKCFPSGNVEEFCDHVFRSFDADKNGFIDFKEFMLAIDITSTGSPKEKLEWAFRLELNYKEGF